MATDTGKRGLIKISLKMSFWKCGQKLKDSNHFGLAKQLGKDHPTIQN
jgi:hypothetical protein